MTIVREHLYRTDDRLFHHVKDSGEAIEFTELESTQVYGDGTFLNPDDTIAMLRIAQHNHKKVMKLGGLLDGDPMKYIYIVVAIVILLSVLKVI